jgi:Putative zincin peptidase
MKILVEQLRQEGYAPLDTLNHKDMVSFIKPYLHKKNIYVLFYNISMTIPLGIIGLLIGYNLGGRNSFDWEMIYYFSIGFTLNIFLIPIHEFLHGLAYQYVGAKRISYNTDLKRFIFYALADHFVVNSKEFKVVALTPFVIVSSVSVLFYFLVPVYWSYTILGLICAHSACCAGDFALLSYLHENRGKEIVTYDDVRNNILYFYAREQRM